ncbi:MAG: recombination protein RecR [Gammaproteobacteria bacterium]|nr:recombination mediator RecR [Gammaproteobacteria bacterium]NND53555.1 recombination protein RecR [Gammaproteobacteria bacterium]
MAYSPLLQQLLQALQCLPGVGSRTAQRMAFYLLQRDREGARELSVALQEAIEHIGECERCRMLSEEPLCRLCTASNRDVAMICVVESPADVIAIEESGVFRGLYFVLHGRLSPLDGIGPGELGLERFEARLSEGEVSEVILATSSTVEGEATAGYLATLAKEQNVAVSRIAHGVPIGGELEYVDRSTLSRAIAGRLGIASD